MSFSISAAFNDLLDNYVPTFVKDYDRWHIRKYSQPESYVYIVDIEMPPEPAHIIAAHGPTPNRSMQVRMEAVFDTDTQDSIGFIAKVTYVNSGGMAEYHIRKIQNEKPFLIGTVMQGVAPGWHFGAIMAVFKCWHWYYFEPAGEWTPSKVEVSVEECEWVT